MTSQIIRNARLSDGSHVDVYVSAGIIEKTTPHEPDTTTNSQDTDAKGQLLLPTLAEPHAHLDKAFLAERMHNQTGDLLGAIHAVHENAHTLTFDDIVERATRAVNIYLKNGTTRIRTHADTFDGSTLQVRALRQVANNFRDLCDIEICALVQWPLTGKEGKPSRLLAERARADGADLIGGCPHLDTDPSQANKVFLSLAKDLDCDLDLHVDETLNTGMLSLRDLAKRVVNKAPSFGVTASHCVSLGMQSAKVQKQVSQLVAEADIAIVTLPQTNLYLQGREHPSAMPRALTALAALRTAGVTVLAGGDNLQDPFNPLGRADPLEAAGLLVSAGHYFPEDAFDAVSSTVHGRLSGELPFLTPGANAHFILTPARSVREFIAFDNQPRSVFRHGTLLHETLEA
jgi:cytosine deaminase